MCRSSFSKRVTHIIRDLARELFHVDVHITPRCGPCAHDWAPDRCRWMSPLLTPYRPPRFQAPAQHLRGGVPRAQADEGPAGDRVSGLVVVSVASALVRERMA